MTEAHKEAIRKATKGNPKMARNHSPELREQMRRNICKPGTAFRKLLGTYKTNARERGLEWALTDDEFRELTSSPCFFTNRLPSRESRADSGEIYLYNGIDRLDNTKGYVPGNCVPCCKEVNIAKSTLGVEEFLKIASEIVCKVGFF